MTELLNMSTVVERDTIAIDGKQYDLVNLDELGPYEHEIIMSRNATAHELLQSKTKKKLTPTQQRTLSKALNDILKILVPDIRAAALGKLSIGQRATIVKSWADRVTEKAVSQGNRQSRRTGAASSRGSKRSTAAPRKTGSTRRRGS